MKVYNFCNARTLLAADPMPPDQTLEKIWRDITHLPQDAVYSVEEWKSMYDKYATGEGITKSVANAAGDIALDVLKSIWEFVYQYSYWIALFGGIAAFLLYVCGHKGALKWLWTLIVVYLFICALGELL